MSFFRRTGALIARFFTSAADPAAVAGEYKLYSKSDAGGDSQLYGRSDDGTVHQITPGTGGGDGNGMVANVAINTAETLLVAYNGAAGMPAGELRVGMVFRFSAYGSRTGAGVGSGVFIARMGPGASLTGGLLATATLVSTASTGFFHATMEITIRTLGAAGGVRGDMMVLANNAAVISAPGNGGATSTRDTTVMQRLELSFQSGDAANTYTFTTASVQLLEPR